MRSTTGRVALAIAVIAIAIVLLVVLRDDGDDEPVPDPGASGAPAETRPGYGERAPQAPAVPRVEVEDGEPVGGVQRLEFSAGERARFEVESDIDEEVHIHGYDIAEDVPAGGSVNFNFPANIEGVFEVELHGSGAQIAELRVTP